jgi:hypothetical protein
MEPEEPAETTAPANPAPVVIFPSFRYRPSVRVVLLAVGMACVAVGTIWGLLSGED